MGGVARLKVSILFAVAFALVQGFIVGVLDRSLVTFFAGFGLGAVNFAVGWATGRFFRRISTRGRLATG